MVVNPFGLDSRLVYSTSAGVTGQMLVSWDFSAFDPPGNELPNLAPIDLTENGQRSGLMLRVGVDQAGSNDPLTVRLVGDDPSEVSTASVSVQVTNGFDTSFVFVPFFGIRGIRRSDVDCRRRVGIGGGKPIGGRLD